MTNKKLWVPTTISFDIFFLYQVIDQYTKLQMEDTESKVQHFRQVLTDDIYLKVRNISVYNCFSSKIFLATNSWVKMKNLLQFSLMLILLRKYSTISRQSTLTSRQYSIDVQNHLGKSMKHLTATDLNLIMYTYLFISI